MTTVFSDGVCIARTTGRSLRNPNGKGSCIISWSTHSSSPFSVSTVSWSTRTLGRPSVGRPVHLVDRQLVDRQLVDQSVGRTSKFLRPVTNLWYNRKAGCRSNHGNFVLSCFYSSRNENTSCRRRKMLPDQETITWDTLGTRVKNVLSRQSFAQCSRMQ